MPLESQQSNPNESLRALSREYNHKIGEYGAEKVPKEGVSNEELHAVYDDMQAKRAEFERLFDSARTAESEGQPKEETDKLYAEAYAYRDNEMTPAEDAYDALWETPTE